MATPNSNQIAQQVRLLAPISDEEIEQLVPLIGGLTDATARLKEILPGFPDDLDGSSLSRTVDGDPR
ncbi:MAG: hypothetical protein HQ478_08740 [Chloroflexi bacterium]|nr:hypothetical protein [Chloroflexota bacterium]